MSLKLPAKHDMKAERVAAPLRQVVTENIRNAIALGHFVGGQRLPERELCELTGVSRTLVREALRQLESEGLIEIVPHRGPIVATLSLKQAEDIYRVREELEGLASELFAKSADENDRKKLKKAFTEIKKALKTTDKLVRLEAKNNFYTCLFEGSGNSAIGPSLGHLNSKVVLLRATSLQQPGRLEESVKEIGKVVDALMERDGASARRLAVEHVRNAAFVALKNIPK
jgi:DNA-binding GntR family transcriptional regulator